MRPLRLHLNENGAGCAPAVLDAIRSMTAGDVAEYPDSSAATARAAEYFGVDPGCVLLTNGLDEGLLIAALFAASSADGGVGDAVIAEPCFQVYARVAEVARLRIVSVTAGPSLAWPLDAVLAAMTTQTRVVFIGDPNNPTGLAAPSNTRTRVTARTADALVVIDEAYAEFSGRTSIPEVVGGAAPALVGRTFAKAHGLAGLRAGALIGAPALIARLRPLALPFRMNAVALRALPAALEDAAHLRRSVADARESRELLYAWARRAGFEYWPSDANFVLVRIGDRASEIAGDLAARGVLVRDTTGLPGCEGCLRITAARPAAARAALAELEAALAACGR
jgi:histidinol-phosphate aminotransferase